MITSYISLAFKNVRRRGLRSWLTMLGVFVGVAAVVGLISLGQGLEAAITGQFGDLSVDTLVIQGADTGFSPPGSTSVRKMTEKDLEIIEKVNGVRIAIPRHLRAAKIEFNDILGFAFVASIPEDREKMDEVYETMNIGVSQGKLLKEGESGKVVVGNDFVKTEMYEKPVKVGSTLKIEEENFEVIGILERSSTFIMNGAILMMEDDLKRIYGIDDEIDFIAARVEDKDDVENVAEEIKRKLRKEYDQKEGQEDFEVQTPLQSLETVNTILNIINIVVTGIALIALLVGGIGIANTMFTSVLERTREIGLMKAVGAKNRDVLFIFLFESGLLGLVGGIVGALIGLGLALGVASGANVALGNTIFTVSASLPLLFSSVGFAFLIGVVSGIVPAMQASRLNPVEALRK